jgi:hypothetical protein
MEIIAEGLKNNHTILGLHLLGNEAETDPSGFVKARRAAKESKSHVYSRILPSMVAGHVHNTRLLELKVSSNCWICEGWTEVRFEF